MPLNDYLGEIKFCSILRLRGYGAVKTHEMKQIALFAILLSLCLSLFSCEKDNKSSSRPVVEFQEKIYTIHPSSTVIVAVTLDKPAERPLSIPFEISGIDPAEEQYVISATAFHVEVGEMADSLVIYDSAMPLGSSITLKLLDSPAAAVGTNYTCVVTKDASEIVVYNFSVASTQLIETSKIDLTLTGAYSGARFRTETELRIPVVLEGEGAQYIDFADACDAFLIPKGGNTASVTLSVNGKADDLASIPAVIMKVGECEGTRLIAGETGSVEIRIESKLQTPDKLAGVWKFGEIYDAEDIALFAEEDGFDVSAFPFVNESFTLSFTEDPETGAITLTPGGDGAFNWFFRKAEVTMGPVMNVGADGSTLGKYSSLENNMYMSFMGVEPEVFTHYSLSSANRLFDPENERLGPATIAISLSSDGNELHLIFKDYDVPPFLDVPNAEIWYDGTDFDSDLLGFASRFVRVE